MCSEQRAQTVCWIERQQFIPVGKIDQDRMSAASFVFRLDEPGSASPFVDQNRNRCRRHGRMIDQSNNYRPDATVHFFDAKGNRLTHLTIRVGIDGKAKVECSQVFSNFFSAMAEDDNDVLNVSRAKIANAVFDNRRITEGEQRFEDAHAARATGGEDNCGDVSHDKS